MIPKLRSRGPRARPATMAGLFKFCVIKQRWPELYAGAAFIALSDDARTEFIAEVGRLTTSWAAFKSSRLTGVKWCEPKLAVRVKHLAGSKTLRHATVRALAQ